MASVGAVLWVEVIRDGIITVFPFLFYYYIIVIPSAAFRIVGHIFMAVMAVVNTLGVVVADFLVDMASNKGKGKAG
ncbi:MAG: hypothetical protein CME98_18925 [Hyphomonas sp.]|nr:hypothetical protein [Hyphomonas sp.]